MKITASRRDDILKEKAEYEEQMNTYEEAKQKASRSMREDEEAVYGPIREYIESNLQKFDLLTFGVQLQRNYEWDRDEGLDGVEIRVLCNDHNHFDDNVALSWNYDVKVEDGEVKAESSSWSGLKAVTAEQLESLKQTVSAIEFLQSVDWVGLLANKLKKYDEYYKTLPDMPERRDFDKDLLEEDIKDSFGKGIGFPGKLEPEYESRWNTAQKGYYFFYGETPAQYKCVFVPSGYVNRDDNLASWKSYVSRMKKEKVLRNLNKKEDRVTVPEMAE